MNKWMWRLALVAASAVGAGQAEAARPHGGGIKVGGPAAAAPLRLAAAPPAVKDGKTLKKPASLVGPAKTGGPGKAGLTGKPGKNWTASEVRNFRARVNRMSLRDTMRRSWRTPPRALRSAMLRRALDRHHHGFRFRFFSPIYRTWLYFDPITQTWYYFSPLLGQWVPIAFIGVAPPPANVQPPTDAGTPPAPPSNQTPQVPPQQPKAQEPPAGADPAPAAATQGPGAARQRR
jgi:hypothetical protein